MVHPPGTPLFSCNCCLKVRTRDVPICPACRCPEFSLFVVGDDGQFHVDRSEPAPHSPKPKRARKVEPTAPEPPAHIIPPDFDFCSLHPPRAGLSADKPKRARKAKAKATNDMPGLDEPLIGEPAAFLEACRDARGEPGSGRECAGCGRIIAPDKAAVSTDEGELCSPCFAARYNERVALLDSPAMDGPPLHEYEVSLPPTGDERTDESLSLGYLKAPSLAEAIRRAPCEFAGDLAEGYSGGLVVEPCKAHLDGVFAEVAECASCGRRWPKAGGVGCPDCVHGPIPEIARVQAGAHDEADEPAHEEGDGYPPSHPWYYALGGKPLSVEEIVPSAGSIGYRKATALDNLKSTRLVGKGTRAEKLGRLLDLAEKGLEKDVAKYLDLIERGWEAMSDREQDRGGEHRCSDLDSALSFKHNHILHGKGMVAAIRELIAESGPEKPKRRRSKASAGTHREDPAPAPFRPFDPEAESAPDEDLDDSPAFVCTACGEARQPHRGHPCPKCKCETFRVRGEVELTDWERERRLALEGEPAHEDGDKLRADPEVSPQVDATPDDPRYYFLGGKPPATEDTPAGDVDHWIAEFRTYLVGDLKARDAKLRELNSAQAGDRGRIVATYRDLADRGSLALSPYQLDQQARRSPDVPSVLHDDLARFYGWIVEANAKLAALHRLADELANEEAREQAKPAKPARKPPRKTFRCLYRWDDDTDPIVMEEIKARDRAEAKAEVPRIYSGNWGTVRLPSGDVVPIDHDKVELVEVPGTPRKKKEAVLA